MIVKFATSCDECNRQSEEYTSWPTCIGCKRHVCVDCDVASERNDERHATLCYGCLSAMVDV